MPMRVRVTERFMAQLKAQAPKLREYWGVYPGDDSSLITLSAGAWLAFARYLDAIAAADAAAVREGLVALFGTN